MSTERITIDEYRKAAKQSAKQRLENKFLDAFALVKPEGVPMPEREYRFHPERKWRFDAAFPQIKLAVEIHGGSFVRGRHNTARGQATDCDKHNEAARLGWCVLQFSTVHLKDPAACAAYVVDVIATIGESRKGL